MIIEQIKKNKTLINDTIFDIQEIYKKTISAVLRNTNQYHSTDEKRNG